MSASDRDTLNNSMNHSHAAVCRSTTPRALHTRPAVVTRVAAGGVVRPAGVDAPCAATGGHVQVHECSPLSSSGGGNDAHSNTPVDRRVHVRDMHPMSIGGRHHQPRIDTNAIRTVVLRVPTWRCMRG
jgi:hypothetical protein